MESQLQPERLNFVAKRVERFMRELDIPGIFFLIYRKIEFYFFMFVCGCFKR